MRKVIRNTLVVLASLGLAASAMAQAPTKEIRVLLANHPYGELLKAAIPEFESATGIKVNAESLQESQLTAKLTTEFATNSSSVDVFMTRPLQEGKMFYKNGWYEPLSGYDFSDYPKNVMSVATFGAQVVHRSAGDRMAGALLPEGPSRRRRNQGSRDLRRARGCGKEAQFRQRGGLRVARKRRGSSYPAVELRLQLRRPVSRQGRRRLQLQAGRRRHPFLRNDSRQLRAEGRARRCPGKTSCRSSRPERSPCGRMPPCSMVRSSILPRRSWARTRSASRTSRPARRRIRRSSSRRGAWPSRSSRRRRIWR